MSAVTHNLILALCAFSFKSFCSSTTNEVIQLYYGLDESERGVPACGSSAQACGALLQRYWRRPAHLRLCRCPRRRPCPVPPLLPTIAVNKRTHLQFCEEISNLPACNDSYVGLSIEMNQPDYSPDELDTMHHSGLVARPPNLTAYCLCSEPYYWQLYSRNTTAGVYPTMLLYKCVPFKSCRSGDVCGNVRADTEALYQTCWCPRGQTCVHDGGLEMADVEELMFKGKAWKAYCQNINLNIDSEFSDEI